MSGEIKEFKTKYGDFLIDTERDSKMISLITNSGYETKDLESALPTRMVDVSVDVGAHIGMWTVPLARTSRRVHSFEPIKENAELLRENIKRNGLSNVKIHEHAVGNREERLAVTFSKKGNSAGTVLGKGTQIESVTLDSLIPHADFIKIDVEGMEYDVLMGARKLLRKSRPVIQIEINKRLPRWKALYIWLYLLSLGYTLSDHFLHRSTFNVLATPK